MNNPVLHTPNQGSNYESRDKEKKYYVKDEMPPKALWLVIPQGDSTENYKATNEHCTNVRSSCR